LKLAPTLGSVKSSILHRAWRFHFFPNFLLKLKDTWTFILTVGILVSRKSEFTKNSTRIANVMEIFCALLQCRVVTAMDGPTRPSICPFVMFDKALAHPLRNIRAYFLENIQRIFQLRPIANGHVRPSVRQSCPYTTSLPPCPSSMTTLLQCRVDLSMFHSSSTSKIWHTST
jgi:hypothetical protein